MLDPFPPFPAAHSGLRPLLRRLFGTFRLAYLPCFSRTSATAPARSPARGDAAA